MNRPVNRHEEIEFHYDTPSYSYILQLCDGICSTRCEISANFCGVTGNKSPGRRFAIFSLRERRRRRRRQKCRRREKRRPLRIITSSPSTTCCRKREGKLSYFPTWLLRRVYTRGYIYWRSHRPGPPTPAGSNGSGGETGTQRQLSQEEERERIKPPFLPSFRRGPF